MEYNKKYKIKLNIMNINYKIHYYNNNKYKNIKKRYLKINKK